MNAPPSISKPALGRSKRRAAGFTLVELMVALSGGLFLAIVVFTLSRDASRFYQREVRMANATLAGVSGFERLSGDLALAGHLCTANIDADPRVCNRPDATWPSTLRRLRALLVGTNSAALTATELGPDYANLTPQAITIAGAINVPEVFVTDVVAPNAAGVWQVFLNMTTGAVRRVGMSEVIGSEATNLTIMRNLFKIDDNTGRVLRLRKGGQDQYAVVADVGTAPGPLYSQAFINLAPAPQLQRTQAGGSQCGISGQGEGMAVSVLNLIRYDIRPMTAEPAYKALFDASGKMAFETGRTELVRVELAPNGQEVAATRELVSEYAVDLRVGGWRATSATDPTLVAVAPPLDDTSPITQLLRGMHLRLSVRSREPDRERDVYGAAAGDLFRIPLGRGKTAPFARVRTLQSDVALRNLEDSRW